MIKKYSFIIGIIIFLLILNKLGFREMIDILTQVNLYYFGLATFLLLPILFIRAYRWNYLKKKQGIIFSLKDSFLINNISMIIGLVTPGRLGELTKILYLKNKNYSIGKSLVSVLLDRLADLFFLLFFSLISLIFFFSYFKKTILLLALILSLFILVFILISKNNLVQIILKKMLGLIIPSKFKKSWLLNYHDFLKNLKIYTLNNYFSILFITAFSWLIYYFQSFLLLKSIGINNIPFFYLAITVTIAGFVTLLPISISGLGTREATLIFFFSFFQVPLEKTIGFSLLILSTIVSTALIGLICWLFKQVHQPTLVTR
ncbi:MAG: lysylphosphatidylglycerol synthase transmembrane domain-containing protein [Patescibacteria group bacterium]|nr:flippase-like domain-containing protein [Patescibacteria group bacterium]